MKCRGSCSVYGCKNKVSYNNLSFFKLPKDPKVCETWLQLIDRPELLTKPNFKYSSYRVCSVHFEDSDINIVRLLKPGSVPTKFLPVKDDPLALKTERASEVESKQTEDSSVELEPSTSKKLNINALDHSDCVSGSIIPKQTQNSICCCKKPLNCDTSIQTPQNFMNSLPHIKKLREQLHKSLIKQRVIGKKYKELQSILAKGAKSNNPIRLKPSKRATLLRPVTVSHGELSVEDKQEQASIDVLELESFNEKHKKSYNPTRLTSSKKRKLPKPDTVTESDSSNDDNEENVSSTVLGVEPIEENNEKSDNHIRLTSSKKLLKPVTESESSDENNEENGSSFVVEQEAIEENNKKSDNSTRLTSIRKRKLLKPVTDSESSDEDAEENESSFVVELEAIEENNEKSDNPTRLTSIRKRNLPKPVTDSESSDEDAEENVSGSHFELESIKDPTDIDWDPLSDEEPSTSTIKPKQGTTENNKRKTREKNKRKKNKNDSQKTTEDVPEKEFEDYFNKWQKEILSNKNKKK